MQKRTGKQSYWTEPLSHACDEMGKSDSGPEITLNTTSKLLLVTDSCNIKETYTLHPLEAPHGSGRPYTRPYKVLGVFTPPL